MTLGRVFVDTGAWFAIQVVDDAHHNAASAALPVLLDASQSLVTSNLVVGETYTLLRISKGYQEARRFLETLGKAQDCSGCSSRRIWKSALRNTASIRRPPVQLHRCHQLALMRQQRIHHAFAFDPHFATAGFLRIPVDLPLAEHG